MLAEHRSNQLIRNAKNKVGVSIRKLTKQYRVSKNPILRKLSKNNMKYQKRKKCPKYNENQLQRCCRALQRIHFASNQTIIIDEEKYFTLIVLKLKGMMIFTTIISKSGQIVSISKKKLILLIKYSQCYIENCLTNLVDFIQENHAQDDIMLWPDLAVISVVSQLKNFGQFYLEESTIEKGKPIMSSNLGAVYSTSKTSRDYHWKCLRLNAGWNTDPFN